MVKITKEKGPFISGYRSDGTVLDIVYPSGKTQSFRYSEEKEKAILAMMEDQVKTATKNYREYSSQEDFHTAVSSLYGMLSIMMSAVATRPNAQMFLGFGAAFLLGAIRQFKKAATESEKIDTIRKCSYFLKHQDLINDYIKKLYDEETNIDGYEPNYMTLNDMDSYSLKELKELVEGIKTDNEEAKLTLK